MPSLVASACRPVGAVRLRLRLLALLGATLIGASCGSNDTPNASAPEPSTTPATSVVDSTTAVAGDPSSFSNAILPIVEQTCARCHTGNGPGTAHLRFETAADVSKNSLDIAAVVGAGIMPPWPASDHSLEFRDDWSLTAEEIDAVVSWQAAGAELDIAADTPVSASLPVLALDDADVELAPTVGYDGEAGQPDEYRCYVYDPQLENDQYISAYEFVPDQTEVVHHAIGYIVEQSRRSVADEIDGADGQGGWSCFGSSGLGEDEIFLGWAPGQTLTRFPDGAGLRLGPGDFLVVQVHYHFEVDAPADHSSLRIQWADDPEITEVDIIEFLAPTEIPCMTGETGPLCDRDTAMQAALDKYGSEGVQADRFNAICGVSPADFAHMTNGLAWSSCDLPVRASGQLFSVLGHMHEIGASFKMTLNPDSPDELVLLDIPVWDFDWQLNYEPVAEIMLEPNDTIRIECSWDRALRSPDLEPAYIFWADGTNDEMCFATMTVL